MTPENFAQGQPSDIAACADAVQPPPAESSAIGTPRWQAGASFPQSVRDALFAAILVHDDIHADAELPLALRLDYDQSTFARSFDLSRQLWDEYGATDTLARLVGRIAARGRLDPADATVFKHIRARYKQLRFAYAVFDDRHVYPRAFDFLTRVMSSLQDALVLGRRGPVLGHAIALRLLLSAPFRLVVSRELAGFRPTTAQGFCDYLLRDIAGVRDPAENGRVTARQFHRARKIISRQAALYDCLRVLYPSAYHDQMSRYISTINGLMGAMHDDMIRDKYAGARDYETAILPVPERITAMLLAFGALHEAAGRPAV